MQDKYGHQLHIAEVDESGRFKIRAYPGENYPFVYGLNGVRNYFDATDYPPVIVKAGEETTCNIDYVPKKIAKGTDQSIMAAPNSGPNQSTT